MRIIPVLGVILVLFTGCGIQEDEFELVGFTSEATAPIGKSAMSRMCQAQYSDSRMCTTYDITQTANVHKLPLDTYAWIEPIITEDENLLSCSDWKPDYNKNVSGVVVNNKGLISIASCNQKLPVACCAPVQSVN